MTIQKIEQEINNRINELECKRLNAHQRCRTIDEAGKIINECDREIWVLQDMLACIIHK